MLLEHPSTPVLSDDFERVLQSKMTVFSFQVANNDGKQLDMQELRNVWRWLNKDISRRVLHAPVAQRRALAPCCHIGQPVALGTAATDPAVLRIAIGGVPLSTVAQDALWGATYHDRVERLHDELLGLRRKLEAIASNYASLDTPPVAIAEVQSA